MKFTVDVDCTPEEARKFIGLPDVSALQERMMKELEAQMVENIRSLDPEQLAKTWFPMTIQNWGEMQKAFWNQMGIDPNAPAPRAKDKKGDTV